MQVLAVFILVSGMLGFVFSPEDRINGALRGFVIAAGVSLFLAYVGVFL
jgi:hypothetical membrane protein